MEIEFCAVKYFPQTDCRFPTNKVRLIYESGLGQWSQAEMQRKMELAASVWAKYANLQFSSTSGEAVIRSRTCRIDGPTNTLAWSTLPCGGENTAQQCYDKDERWVDDPNASDGQIDIVSVLIHELGHALGLPHTNERGNIMYPAYTGPMRDLGPWDREQIIRRYGRAGPSPPIPRGGSDAMDVIKLLCQFGLPILSAICATFPPRTGGSEREGTAHDSRNCECRRVLAEALRDLARSLERN